MLLAAVVLSGCASSGGVQTGAQDREGERHTVSVVGALIAPAKTNRTRWDAGSVIDETLVSDLAKAMAAAGDPYVAAAAVVAAGSAGVANATVSPDVVGRAELWVSGKKVSVIAMTPQKDTFTPQWSSVEWESVNVGSARVRVVLEDADVAINDPIGVAEIDSVAMKAAAATGRVHPVNVAAQTNGQVLFVNISVM